MKGANRKRDFAHVCSKWHSHTTCERCPRCMHTAMENPLFAPLPAVQSPRLCLSLKHSLPEEPKRTAGPPHTTHLSNKQQAASWCNWQREVKKKQQKIEVKRREGENKKLAGHCSTPSVLLFFFSSSSLHQSCIALAAEELLTCAHLSHPSSSPCLPARPPACVRSRLSQEEWGEEGREAVQQRKAGGERGRDEGIRENRKREEKDRRRRRWGGEGSEH